jgi:hypothetical protein
MNTVLFDFNKQIEIEKKIKLEKRRRNQSSLALDYFLANDNWFDYLSFDTSKIVIFSKLLARQYNQDVTIELLLIPYFTQTNKIFLLLPESNLKQKLRKKISKLNGSLFNLENSEFSNIFSSFRNKISLNQRDLNSIAFNAEVRLIFEEAAQNALIRFKTPVLTPEILFITIMENSLSTATEFIESLFETDMDWYLFRYQLIKLIYAQESTLRRETSKNQEYFAYLLKSKISNSNFTYLIEKDSLKDMVWRFRNLLIYKILKKDLFKFILEEISSSIKISKKRIYSSEK